MRKILLATALLGVIAFVAVIGVFLLRSDNANLATEAPAISTDTEAAGGDAAVPPVELPAGVRRFVIDPSGSSAKYVVKENLRLIDTTAVGETSAISGEIYLSPDGLYAGAASSFTIDLRELESDESRRDSYIKRTTLDTSRFPFAEFAVESLSGFPAGYVEDTQVELTLSGSMTIHGVSQPMTFSVLARQAGDSLTAAADADFKMTDFGIEPPSVQIATARNEVHIQIVLLAREPAA